MMLCRFGLRLMAICAIVAAVGVFRGTVAGQSFSCHTDTCIFDAECEGDVYEDLGCSIQCYNLDGKRLTKGGRVNCGEGPLEGH